MKIVVAGSALLESTRTEIESLAHEVVYVSAAADLTKALAGAEFALVSPGIRMDGALIESSRELRYIGVCGTSTGNIDSVTARSRGITITNVVDYSDEAAAEFVFMQLTALARGVNGPQWRSMPTELMGKTIGIVGAGSLGSAIANLAFAYKMQVVYFSRDAKPPLEQRGARYRALLSLVAASDIIILSGPTNHEMLSSAVFAEVRNGAVIVQTSTGTVMNHESFVYWVRQDGNYAIFDMAAGEENRLRYGAEPHVIFSTMVSAYTQEGRMRLGSAVVTQLKSYLNRSPEN